MTVALWAITLSLQAQNYLTFTAEESNATIKFDGPNCEYLLSGQSDWTHNTGQVITLTNIGDQVQFRCELDEPMTQYSKSYENYYHFTIPKKVAASGNIMSLMDKTCNKTSLEGADYAFLMLFSNESNECPGLTTAPELPATTLANNCYEYMFFGCTNLTTAPELPATTLADYCYRYMFIGCTNLTNAPELPATTLARNCYDGMFSGCTSLTTTPELPATILAESCYDGMFDGCTNLTNAPELPATTLADYCYRNMFSGCTSLTTAPELPATTLAKECYIRMFSGCTSLTTTPELPATILAESCYSGMFSGCKGLTAAPELPATILAEKCYLSMFSGCTGLTETPKLHATTLADYCYSNMFAGCTGLTKISPLPATTLAIRCYNQMFHNCSNLVVNMSGPGREWSIPADAVSASNWNYNMFYETGGDLSSYNPYGNGAGSPRIGTVYYIASCPPIMDSFSLADGESYIETEIEATELTYTRTFSNTAWQSMYVPFDIPVSVLEENGLEVAEIYNVHQYDRDDDGVYEETNIDFLKMKSGTALANYPYMVRAKEAGDVTIVMENTILHNAVSASIDCSTVKQLFTFTGTYNVVSGQMMYNNNYYAMNGNGGLQRAANQSVSLKAQRWYLSITNRDGSPVNYYAPNVRITVDGIEEDGLGTSIDGIASLSNNESVYSITGICINNNENLTPGIYVNGGKKFIVK